jgi:hypothetical protein
LEWAQGLVDHRQPEKALPLIRKGLERADGMNQPRLSARLLMLQARARYDSGDFTGSELSLQKFERRAISFEIDLLSELHARDVLRIRLETAAGNDRGAMETAETALARLEHTLRRMGASGHGYLWAASGQDLRLLLHDLAKEDPNIGYGIELYWRDIYRILGSAPRNDQRETGGLAVDSISLPLMEQFRARASDTETRITARGAVHCIFLAHGEEVWRWTCSNSGIRRETLGPPVATLDSLIQRTRNAMAADPRDIDASPGNGLVTDLRALGKALLPPEILFGGTDTGNGTFFVSTRGLLSKVPFETFDVSDGEKYIPLLAHRDVAYLRHADESRDIEARGPGIILANENPAGKFWGLSTIGRVVRATIEEGRAAAEALPDATFLHGNSATEANLRDKWEQASFIYLASHFVRAPNIPYLSFVPLANPDNVPGPEASFLDVEDVRASNLERCDVVVLSGCASGAPYIGVKNTSAGFGAAFLDAGAGAVIQTFWDVGDESAKNLMMRFIDSWSNDPSSVIPALSKTKRSFMTGPNGIRHPFTWAAYAVQVSRL